MNENVEKSFQRVSKDMRRLLARGDQHSKDIISLENRIIYLERQGLNKKHEQIFNDIRTFFINAINLNTEPMNEAILNFDHRLKQIEKKLKLGEFECPKPLYKLKRKEEVKIEQKKKKGLFLEIYNE